MKKLCMVFIVLEKVYDRVSREFLKWTLRGRHTDNFSMKYLALAFLILKNNINMLEIRNRKQIIDNNILATDEANF